VPVGGEVQSLSTPGMARKIFYGGCAAWGTEGEKTGEGDKKLREAMEEWSQELRVVKQVTRNEKKDRSSTKPTPKRKEDGGVPLKFVKLSAFREQGGTGKNDRTKKGEEGGIQRKKKNDSL